MHDRLRLICSTALLSFSLISSSAWSWGTKGHETVEEVAIRLLPRSSFSQLLKNNENGVKFLSMVPDMNWKHGSDPHPLEGQAHFFAYDFYSSKAGGIPTDVNAFVAKYGMDAALKNGTAPFRMQQMSAILLKALKTKNPTLILQMAATLGHYVGDLGNPLHVSMDFDGQQIKRPGLHSYFETKSVNEIPGNELLSEVGQRASAFLQHIPNDVNPINGAMMLAEAGFKKTTVVDAAATRLGLTESFSVAMKPTIYTTLAMSSAMLAKIWNEAYVLAGSPELSTKDLGSIPVPEWVPMSYLKGAKAPLN